MLIELKKIIAFATCAVVFLMCFFGLYVQTHAEEISTITISGEDLAALILSGTWECYNIIGGTDVVVNWKNCSVINGDCVVKFNESSFTSGQTWTNSSIYFDTALTYDNVVAVTALVGGNVGYFYRNGPSSDDMSWNSKKMTYADGYVQGTTTIDFQDASPSDLNGTYQFSEDGKGYSGGFAMLSAAFDSMTMRNLMLNGFWNDINLTMGMGVNLPDECVFVIDSITISLTDDSSGSGGSGEDSGGGTSSETQQAILNQIEEANKKLDEITTPSIEDENRLDDLKDNMQDAQDKADEYNEVMDSVETPEPEEVIPEDSVEDIMKDEHVSEGQPYIFSILESLQSITWILTMILISVTVGIIKYIIYGKT